MSGTVRDRADACPGTLATHQANDGPLARIRIPGGRLTAHQVQVLAACAQELGDGRIHLTSRANLQLRAVTDPAALASRLGDAGLLPSATHERVRNILASPLTGIAGGTLDVAPLVIELDHAIRAEPELATLSGRFQFGIDDGRGDLPVDGIDVGWRADTDDARTTVIDDDATAGTLLLAGEVTDVRVPAARVADVLVRAALAFLRLRALDGSGAWHLRELDHAAERVAAAIIDDGAPVERGTPDRARLGAGGATPAGVIRHDHDRACAVVAGALFGTLNAEQLHVLAGTAPAGIVITPWRSVVVPSIPPARIDDVTRNLRASGLRLDDADPSTGVTACVGSPGCASSHADVRHDTRAALPRLPAGVAVHVAGCARRCGQPRLHHIDVVATGDGYTVDGTPTTADALATTIGAAYHKHHGPHAQQGDHDVG
ncbi:precorrin-3B synthase [Phytoactinopolyspora halotolerans]|uniref:Precorrin-3B synthase n=1 Tax=Phytoactinopolyspora halotolerans TaxID=1981512 RepID=A0A6L9S3Q8_9ACTN|nr:precorrin-3B synthase [Phytoactinopolyspora halotolerans]NED98609.1 precorrin-3B synthase [Phytoactinopolyspora halotolerans]